MRLPRPHIPLKVRMRVAARQVTETLDASTPNTAVVAWGIVHAETMSKKEKLTCLLRILFGDEVHRAELHHRPALVNRRKRFRLGVHVGYKPAANDPDALIYLLDDAHDVETRVRGVGAQHSDLGLARKNKNIDRRLAGTKRRGPKLRGANRWPPKGSRKIPKRVKR